MTTATLESSVPATAAPPQAQGRLALALQEAFTVAVRVRVGRQVAADAASFRAHIKQLLAAADASARGVGYSGEEVRLAIYAFVAFLDESVLNSTQPMFASWPSQPLQEEVFGDHMAGETFFRHLEGLLARQDSGELADVLEVFLLCMLLGFRGRYGTGGLEPVIATTREKILRVRGGRGELSPAWGLPADEVVPTAGDPWIPRLGIVAVALLVLAVVLFVVFKLSLDGRAADLQTLVSQLIG